MKPIKLEDASREKRKKATKKHKQRPGSNELLDESAVDEDGDDNAQQDEGEDKKDPRNLFYDIEARQEGGYYISNLLIVQDEKSFEMVFRGEDCVEKLGEWLLDRMHKGAILIAHNSRSYDSYFLCEYFYKECPLPKWILNGAKIMSMELEAIKIKFRDSLNFLPKTCGLTELKKGYFLHFFNRKDMLVDCLGLKITALIAQSQRTPGVPCLERRAQVNQYYVFDFEKEIKEYCRSDVHILRRCCLEF